MNTNRIRDRLIVIIGDNVSPSGDAARWELYDAALGILSEFVLIPKTDLPGANPHPTNPNIATFGHTTASRNRRAGKAETHYERALAHLAAAKWIDAEPPVNEGDVEALADLMVDIEAENIYDYHDLARRLIQTGQVQVNRDE